MTRAEELEEWEARAATIREKLDDHSKLTGPDDPLRLAALEIVLHVIEKDIIAPLREERGNDR